MMSGQWAQSGKGRGRRRLVLLVLAIGIVCACGAPAATTMSPAVAPAPGGEVVVFAAASLTEAFTEIGSQFSAANPGVRVSFNFAGSQQLAQQIVEGAPADVFASASMRQMQVGIDAGAVVAGSAQVFVRNRLVVVLAPGNPGQITALADLARPGLTLVLAAQAVPAGQYSLDFLERASADPAFGADYSAAVLANVVSYEENVRVVLGKVALGEADAGMVYTSDITGDAAAQLERIAIPDTLNTTIAYLIAVVQTSARQELAGAFIAYVRSPAGQEILAQYGFMRADGLP